MRILRTAQAENDLIEIWAYVAIHDMAAADALLDRIEARWRLLATQPRSGRTRDDLKVGLRQVTTGNYLTFYHLQDDALVVLRVLHGSRDIGSDEVSG